MPYSFEVFANEEEAKERYESVDSWMPKYYFQPVFVETGHKHPNYWCVSFNCEPVSLVRLDKISDVLRESTLLLLESGFSNEIQGPLAIIEPGGNRLEMVEPIPGMGQRLSIPRNCSEYCRKIRTTTFNGKSGNRICINFDISVLERIRTGKEPDCLLRRYIFEHGQKVTDVYVYVCWAGLVDYVSSIKVEDKLLAVVFSGQRQLMGEKGKQILSDGIHRVSRELRITERELRNLLKKDKEHGQVIDVDKEDQKCLTVFSSITREIINLAQDCYTTRYQERADYFLQEVTHIIESGYEGAYGLKGIDQVLNRLMQFFGLKEAYFLISNIQNPQVFEILAKGSEEQLNGAEKRFLITLDIEGMRIQDQINVNELPYNGKYMEIRQKLQQIINHFNIQQVWIGNCPLMGANNGIWIFINPVEKFGSDVGRILRHLDRHFLKKFCFTLHSVIARRFASSLVMRRIGHELGAGIQSIVGREETIAKKAKEEEIRNCATINLAQMGKYHCLVENLRRLFIRSERDTYIFKKHSITRPVMEVYETCIYDDEVERRNIELHKPLLKGFRTLEMDLDAIKIALFNLIQNAIKYSFNGHYIDIKGIQVDDKQYSLKITNFGVGITKEEIKRRYIFKEDYRGLLSGDRNRSGTGLGLAIVDNVIRNHNGKIKVSSTSAIEIDYMRKNNQPLPDSVIGRLIKRGYDLDFGFFTEFIIYLPFSQKEKINGNYESSLD